MKCSLVAPIFLKSSILSTILLFSSNSCTVQLQRLPYLSLIFSGCLPSIGYSFPFFLCLSLLLFSVLFLRPPQATTFPSHICFSWGWFWWPRSIQCYKPPPIVLQATRLNPLNLFHLHYIIIRDLIQVIAECSSGFPYFNLSLNIACFCLSIGARSPPTTPSGYGAKAHKLRTVALGFCLAIHVYRCVNLIKSRNLSCLIWKMGTMMIIPPSRLHVCLLRTSGTERTFWVPESGTNMNYPPTQGEGNLLLRGYGCHPQG